MATPAEIAAFDTLAAEVSGLVGSSGSADAIWLLVAGFLVFWMHAGFTMLETGSVQHKNSVNILFKNIGTISIGSIMYFLFGWGFAYGLDNEGEDSYGFVGSGEWADSTADPPLFFFQAMFAATAATIVSGAVAGRINLTAYFIIAVYLTGLVYPIISHWIWATGGWASAFTDQADTVFGPEGCGMLDYAGSGVVHLTGGAAAFVFAKVLGPRLGRFDADGTVVPIPAHNVALQALGVFILWFGWYGFNCGSTLAFDGANAGRVAVTTTLSPAAAVVTVMIVQRFMLGHYDIGSALNAALAGLVSITAGCSTVDDYASIIIGMLGGLVYIASSKLMLKLKIDDPVDAIAVHGFCGIWGCLAVGIFATPELIFAAYSSRVCEGAGGLQFGTQVVGVLAIIGWVVLTCLPVAIIMKATGFLRVSEEMELAGLDSSEHNASAFVGDDAVAAKSA